MEKHELIVQGYGISELIVNNKYEKIIRDNIELYQDKYINLNYKKKLKIPLDEANYITHQIDNRLDQIDKFIVDPDVVNDIHRDNNTIHDIHYSRDAEKYIRVYFSGKRKPMDGILRRKREYVLLVIPENPIDVNVINEIAYRNYLYNEHDFIQMDIDKFMNTTIEQEGEFKRIDADRVFKSTNKQIITHINEIKKDKKNIIYPKLLAGLYRYENNVKYYVDKLGLPILN